MMNYALRFRPSSHSSDLSIVFTYPTLKASLDGLRKLRWINKAVLKDPQSKADWNEQFEIARRGKRVVFGAFTDGELEPIKRMMSHTSPQKTEECYSYQELTIEAVLPREVSLNMRPGAMALLIDPEEARAVQWLKAHCNTHKTLNQGSERKFVWEYAGSHLLSANDKTLSVGERFDVGKRPNWRVKRHPLQPEAPA